MPPSMSVLTISRDLADGVHPCIPQTWIRIMPKQFDKPLSNLRRTDWRSFSLSFFMAVAIGACQADNPHLSSPNNQDSKQHSKPNNRAEWRSLLAWDDGCEQSFGSTQASDYSGVETHALGDADELVIVMCAVGGYQPSFLLYRLKEQVPNALALETYVATDGQNLQRVQDKELWGEPVFIADTRELVILNVARQTRDCGTWAKYSFTPNAAKLQEFRVKLPCPSEMAEPVNPDPGSPPEGWRRISSM